MKYLAKLEDKLELNQKYVLYKFELTQPHRFDFKAGQYISFLLGDNGVKYYLCSSPEINSSFEVLVDLDLLGAEYLQGLKFGSSVEFEGPLGDFCINRERVAELILVGRNWGIAPLRSMILDLLQFQNKTTKISLYWQLPNTNLLFWEEEFQDLSENFKNFSFHPVIEKAIPEWSLCRGTAKDCLEIHKINFKADFYLSGGSKPLDEVKNLLFSKGVGIEQIVEEE